MDAFGSNAFLITKVFNLTKVCPLFDIICFQNCFDQIREKNVLVIERKFCQGCKNFQKNIRLLKQFIQTVEGQNSEFRSITDWNKQLGCSKLQEHV